MHQLSTLTVSTYHHFRIRALGCSLTDELCHQFAAVCIATSKKTLHVCGIVASLDCEIGCPYYVCEGREEWRAGEGADVALFCCLFDWKVNKIAATDVLKTGG
jgi:hypothetical protein